LYFFFSSRRRHTRSKRDWSSDVCSSDLQVGEQVVEAFCLGIQQLRAAGGDRIEFLTRFVDEVRRGPDRRQRGPQLVRDVRDELRSEERRVGKECESGWWRDREIKKSIKS